MLDQLNPTAQAALRAAGVDPGAVQAAAASDISESGAFHEEGGESWLCLTADDLLVVTPPNGTTGRIERFPLASVGEARVETLVAGGAVTVEIDGEPRRLLRYSASQARAFGALVRTLEQTRAAEPDAETASPDGDEPPAGVGDCPTCGRRYPDQARPVCPHCLDRGSLFARLLRYLLACRGQVVAVTGLFVLHGALKALMPVLSGRVLFDDVLHVDGRWHGAVVPVVGLLVAVHICAALTQVASGRVGATLGARLIYHLKMDLFTSLQSLSLSFFNKKETGGLLVRVNHDSMNLQFFFVEGLPFLIVNGLVVLGVCIGLLLLNWQLALLVFIPGPVLVVALRRLFPRLRRLYTRNLRARSRLGTTVNDSLTGVRVVKAFGREEFEISRFRPINEDVRSSHWSTMRLASAAFPLLALLTQIGGLTVWAVGGWQVVGGTLTLGTLVSFIGFLALLYDPLRQMTGVVDWWSSAMSAAQRIFEIIDTQPEVADAASHVALPSMRGAVTLRGVVFAYEPNRPVLHDISLDIGAGEMIGLVGHTGAGKSTLTNIITRLYDVNEGSVAIDGVDVKRIRLADLRAQVGIILQEPFLFHGTVIENIGYARDGVTESEIVVAAKTAYAHDFIVSLPAGYETIIGPKGHELSGGERQRISFARAVLRDPRILILDEATSSLDSETEQQIQAAVEHLARDRTTIAIAHRLSTLRSADRLVVLEHGRKVEEGTHAELTAARGVFYRFAEKQRKALEVIGIGELR